jgi:hypothetical protein
MAKHRKPALPPWRDRLNLPQLALPPLVDRIGLGVYMGGVGAIAGVLAVAIAGWPW